MLYVYVVIMKDILEEDIYNHFLSLSVAMTILLKESLVQRFAPEAQAVVYYRIFERAHFKE